MLRSRRRIAALLAGLLLMQALAVAHAFDHPVAQHNDHQCVVCPHGQGGHALAADTPAPALPHPSETATPLAPRPPTVALVLSYRSRAPPVSSL